MIRSRVYSDCVAFRSRKDVRIKLAKAMNKLVRLNLNDARSVHNLTLRYFSNYSSDCYRTVATCDSNNDVIQRLRPENETVKNFSSENCYFLTKNGIFQTSADDPSRSTLGRTEKFFTIQHCNSYPMKSALLSKNFVLRTSLLNHRCFVDKPVGARQFSSAITGTENVSPVQLTGFWRALSESAPVEFAQDSLLWVHAATGLPWWATVVLTTVTIRGMVTIPLALYQNYIFAKVENLHGEMNELVAQLKAETNHAVRKFKWTEKHARAVYNRSFKQQWNKLIVRENCHPLKGTVLVFAQIPLWVTFSAALRNLCSMLPHGDMSAQIIFLELTMGGFGWIPNLTDVDHSLILPVTLGLLNLANVEIQSMLRIKEETKFQKTVTNFFRLLSIGMVPLAAYVPSCICLYWVSSSSFGVFQNLLLISPKIRRIAGVPLTQSERTNPYIHLLERIKSRLSLYKGVNGASKA